MFFVVNLIRLTQSDFSLRPSAFSAISAVMLFVSFAPLASLAVNRFLLDAHGPDKVCEHPVCCRIQPRMVLDDGQPWKYIQFKMDA